MHLVPQFSFNRLKLCCAFLLDISITAYAFYAIVLQHNEAFPFHLVSLCYLFIRVGLFKAEPSDLFEIIANWMKILHFNT